MKLCSPFIFRTFCNIVESNIIPKISVVGAGPAGFYLAQHLLKKLPKFEIDIYERLPVPFGLVRFGVAPDHPEVKNVENTFKKVAEHHNVRFCGNVHVGNDVSIEQLKKAYHVVILAYGADKSKSLNIPGENLENVFPAGRFVGWYNGLPWDKDLPVDLSGEEVIILGQGNVAIDIARILLKPIDHLKKTDITQHALEALSMSKIKKVHLIGRRGPLQVAFTIKELRELIRLENCRTEWVHDDFQGLSEILNHLPRPRKRLSELMLSSLSKNDTVGNKVFKPVFFRTPLEFLGERSVHKIRLGVNKLEGEDIYNQRAILTDMHELVYCKLGIFSIGSQAISIDSNLDFDHKKGVLKNNIGKVSTGLYATGWLATGAVGVILTTMMNSFSVAESIVKDLQSNPCMVQDKKPGYDYVKDILEKKNVQIVSWKDWMKIDNYEVKRGAKLGKPREKILNIQEMLRIASS